jgi:HlyD family secretion protein
MILPKTIRSEADKHFLPAGISHGTERAILSRILYGTTGQPDAENDAAAAEPDRDSDTLSPNGQGQQKMIPRSEKTRIGMMAGVGLAALALNSCGQKPAPAETLPAAEASQQARSGQIQAMRVTRIARRDLSDTITATGHLVVREEAAVGTELQGYRVKAVYVDEGDWVKQGQPLAKLDDTLLLAQIAQAEATLAQQKANAAFNDSNLKRTESLATAGAASTQSLEQARMQAATTRAAVMAAEASVNEMKVMDDRMTLRAPVTGRILQRTLRPGDISAPSTATPYFRIARDGLIELDAELPDARLAQIKVGDPATVTLSSGETFKGKVRFISPRVDQTTSLGRARVEMPYDPALRPGGFAKATFGGHASGGLTVIASAVRYESGGPVLMLVGEGNRVSSVPVKLGDRMGEYVQLLEGPPAGARVLATGSAFTLDGDVIQPIEEEAAATSVAQAPAVQAKAQ